MDIGIPREIKTHEYRVALSPASVRALTARGHRVMVETGAGAGIGCDDESYRAAGATIVADAARLYDTAEMIVKVKEPQPAEYPLLRDGQILFAYLHLAAEPALAEALIASGTSAIAFETVTDPAGRLPLLAPMSAVAGRMAVQVGAHCLEKTQGGAGVLLGGVPGVPPGRVAVLGAGVVGANAIRMAVGLGASVVAIDRAPERLAALDDLWRGRIETRIASADAIATAIRDADLVIGAVLVPGATAPRLVSRAMIATMRPGRVVVDVAIDQGGCFETSRPTTHANPTFVAEGVVHYCVTNMPGAVARSSALALDAALLPFVQTLADRGLVGALSEDPHLCAGLTVHRGRVTHAAVARGLGLASVAPLAALFDQD